MRRKFVNRKREFSFLDDRFATGDRQLLVLYGRRRVGKTALVTEFLERYPDNHVYFLADQQGMDRNARRFASWCATEFEDISPAVTGFADAFEYIVRRTDDEFVVVIDEASGRAGDLTDTLRETADERNDLLLYDLPELAALFDIDISSD